MRISSGRLYSAVGVLLVTFVASSGVAATSGRSVTAAQAGASSASGVTASRTINRVHLVDGHDIVADQRTFSLSVSATTNLQDRQAVGVTWSGAQPTLGTYSGDVNSAQGIQDQFPVVLLECRGSAAPTAPAAQQISPQTCWTQTATERYLNSPGRPFPSWRVDRYALPADRQASVGAPVPYPRTCPATTYTEHWLPFQAESGEVYPFGNSNCAGGAPESVAFELSQDQPGNETYGITGSDGTGSAKFVVWNNQTNASLGCSATVACALVAVPIEGISCDVAAAGLPAADRPTGPDASLASAACQAKGSTGAVPDEAVTGALWWSASNWRNRMTIPLTFAPGPVDCSLSGGKQAVNLYGSELLTAATQSWASKSCIDPSLAPFKHIQTGEPEARNLLEARSIEAAFTSSAPDSAYSVPTVNAPVAFSGFAIGYVIDDANGREYGSLRLTPRLIAKLLTESYPFSVTVRQGEKSLAKNPLDIRSDPEFIALNPAVGAGISSAANAATLFNLSSDSDVVSALTSYLNADPEARAWLDGAPDPWGMKVNAAYQGIKLPVAQWPLLDSYRIPDTGGTNLCLDTNPVPYLPLIAAPTSRLATISFDLQYAISPSQLVCTLVNQDAQGAKLTALGRQVPGHRFLLGLTSLADSARFAINTAALQTAVAATATKKFANADGRFFVPPTDASLTATASLLRRDDQSATWPIPYRNIVGQSGSATAYPGAMVVYAAIPTKGLSKTDAASYADVLRFLAGPGQTAGSAQGQLPPGYLPLTATNGLGALAAATITAAAAVQAQRGALPGVTASPSPVTSGASPAAEAQQGSASPGGSDTGLDNGSEGSSSGSPGSTSSDAPKTGNTGKAPASTKTTFVRSSGLSVPTKAPGAGLLGLAIPAALLGLLLAGLSYPAISIAARRKLRP